MLRPRLSSNDEPLSDARLALLFDTLLLDEPVPFELEPLALVPRVELLLMESVATVLSFELFEPLEPASQLDRAAAIAATAVNLVIVMCCA